MQKQQGHLLLFLFIFMGVSFSSVWSQAKDIGFRCRSVYANPTNFPQIAYSGVLVELTDGKQSLVYVPNSWGPGHESAIRSIILKYEETNPVVKTLWMGEFSLREKAGGKNLLVAVNDISGEYFKSTKHQSYGEVPYHNDIKAMRDYVSKNDLWDASHTKYVPFKESQAHLDWTSEFLKQELQLSNTAHEIGNVLNGVISSGQIMEMDHSKHGMFLPLLMSGLPKYMSTLEVLSKESAFDKKVIRRLLVMSEIFMTSGSITVDQLVEFNDVNNQLLDNWREYSNFLASKMKII